MPPETAESIVTKRCCEILAKRGPLCVLTLRAELRREGITAETSMLFRLCSNEARIVRVPGAALTLFAIAGDGHAA